MNFGTIVRIFLGILFGYFGYRVAQVYLPFSNPSFKEASALVIGLLLAIAGVYLIPTVTKWFRDFTRFFSKKVAAEVISQLHLPRITNPRGEKKEEKKEKWVNPMLVDTSALIDGRIQDVLQSGFVFGTIIIPDFILLELQHIADSADDLKRSRGRRGLEVLEAIKKSDLFNSEVYETGQTSLKNVDDRLLKLAKAIKAKLITNDFNLNKIATVSGVKILNVNELANAIKTPMIPGEEIEVKIIQEGKEKTQGVGYLPDGTMIVVENGAPQLGKKVKAKVSRVIQTVAGRMIFTQVSG
ncbi:MAG TPA: TRAM domain-containing protein [Candidatus Saccharimonadales bacterium]|nr:TRAM domain-containing protein [Candidatus Saccharimonadales bacterium]